MKLPTWSVRLGGALLVALFFLVGLFALMPKRSLGYIAQAQLEKATRFAYEVRIGGAALSGISGVRAEDISLRSRKEVSPNVAPGTLDVDRLRVNAGLFSVLRGKPSGRARIDFPTGHARALVAQKDGGYALDLQFFDVSLMEVGILRDYARLPIRGTLRGSASGAVNGDGELLDANIDLNILGLVLGPRLVTGTDLPPDVGRFFAGELTIPPLDAGDVLLRAAVNEDGALEIGEFVGAGPDLRLGGEGRLHPKAPITNSELDLELSVAVDPEWVNRAQIGALISGVPTIARAQQGDNLIFAVTGPLRKPTFAAAGERRRLR